MAFHVTLFRPPPLINFDLSPLKCLSSGDSGLRTDHIVKRGRIRFEVSVILTVNNIHSHLYRPEQREVLYVRCSCNNQVYVQVLPLPYYLFIWGVVFSLIP